MHRHTRVEHHLTGELSDHTLIKNSRRTDGFGQRPEDLERNGEVVREQRPDTGDVLMHGSSLHPDGVERDISAESPGRTKVPDGTDTWVVTPLVHHEQAIPITLRDAGGAGPIHREWLLDKGRQLHRLERIEHFGMRRGRSGHHQTVEERGRHFLDGMHDARRPGGHEFAMTVRRSDHHMHLDTKGSKIS